ncbi:MAG TPA: hypothetical protein VMZ53_15590 [Kofleriaceae bacterium]|nr:hypothetical protein [Kofleriaceae bacterium]
MRRWLVSVSLVAMACGGHDHNGGGDDDQQTCPCDARMPDSPPDSPTDAPPDAPPVMAAMQVGSTGGTLTTTDGVKLVIPAGALATMTNITITQLTNNLPNGVVSNVYELGPDGTQFATPVELTIPYDVAKLGSQPESDLVVASNNQGQARGTGWSVVNATDHTVSALITHFSSWAVYPAVGGCNLNYGCMKQCSGVNVPELCCNSLRSTCRSKLTTSFPDYVNCYTACTGANQVANFGNSECMSACCTDAGWTHLQQGACYKASGATQSQAQGILDCAAACPATGDRGTFCGPISFSACEWNVNMSPNMGDECDGPNSGGVNSQVLATGLGTVGDQIWGNPQVIHVVSGSYGSASLTLGTTCASAVSASGTMSGTWDGAQFSGTWTFGSSTSGTFTVAPRWPQN